MKTKSELRKHFSYLRNSISLEERTKTDKLISDNLIESVSYKQSDLILIYVSVGCEIDTRSIILYSLSVGKKVAVPYCLGNGMEFYEISSLDDLTEIQFGIPTVDINHSKKAILTENTLCVVPAYAFDASGFRLGYGGGYYDRFLADNEIRCVGLCRSKFFVDALPSEEHDIRTEKIITEDIIYDIF